uniref:Uncharacterized protein n=1 Tax=Panagrellus redivivus TaxID=6233 RepID=A0A7E4VEZ1_PANRE
MFENSNPSRVWETNHQRQIQMKSKSPTLNVHKYECKYPQMPESDIDDTFSSNSKTEVNFNPIPPNLPTNNARRKKKKKKSNAVV